MDKDETGEDVEGRYGNEDRESVDESEWEMKQNEERKEGIVKQTD